MRNIFRHRVTMPLVIGVLRLAILAWWGYASQSWFVESFLASTHYLVPGLPLVALIPAALALSVSGRAAGQVAFQLPAVGVLISESGAGRFRRFRGNA